MGIDSRWEPVPYRMGMALHRQAARGELISEGVIGGAYHFSGAVIDIDRLRHAFAAVQRRHPIFRTHLRVDPGRGAQQRIGDGGPDVLRVVRLTADPDDLRSSAADCLRSAEPFDLTEGRLIRAVLFTDGAQEQVLVVMADHTTCDGIGFGQLLTDLTQAYRTGQSFSAPAYDLTHYARDEKAFLTGPEGAAQRDSWRERLGGRIPEMRLVDDRPRRELSTRGSRFSLDAAPHRLRKTAASFGVTPFMLATATMLDAMRPHTVDGHLSFTAPLSGRLPGTPATLIGNLASLAPVVVQPSEPHHFDNLLRAVRDAVFWSFRHQVVPVEQIIADVAPEGPALLSGYRQIFVSWQHPEPVVFDSVPGRPLPTVSDYAMFDLSVWLTQHESTLNIVSIHREELLEQPLVEGWLRRVSSP